METFPLWYLVAKGAYFLCVALGITAILWGISEVTWSLRANPDD